MASQITPESSIAQAMPRAGLGGSGSKKTGATDEDAGKLRSWVHGGDTQDREEPSNRL